jgi:hypothetical protein
MHHPPAFSIMQFCMRSCRFNPFPRGRERIRYGMYFFESLHDFKQCSGSVEYISNGSCITDPDPGGQIITSLDPDPTWTFLSPLKSYFVNNEGIES